jgi:integrase
MAELRQQTGTAARCLETHDSDAVRTSEAIAARWSEIDLEARTSTVPAGRRNAGKEHIVPLSDRGIEILAAMLRSGDLVLRRSRPQADRRHGHDMLLRRSGAS